MNVFVPPEHQCCRKPYSSGMSSGISSPLCYPINVPIDDPFYRRYNLTCLNFVRTYPIIPASCKFGASQLVCLMKQSTEWILIIFTFVLRQLQRRLSSIYQLFMETVSRLRITYEHCGAVEFRRMLKMYCLSFRTVDFHGEIVSS